MLERERARGAAAVERWCWWLAAGSVVVWFVVYSVCQPGWVADEQRHFWVIKWFAEGQSLPAGFLPMLPAYHWAAAAVARVCGPSLIALRAFNAVLAVLTLALVQAVVRRRRPESAGGALLLFVWNPLFFPYTAMLYTEAAAVFALMAAFYLHLRGRMIWSAGALLLACLLRQSSIVWVVFLATWALADVWRDLSNERSRALRDKLRAVCRVAAPRLWGHVVLVLVAAALFVAHPAFSAGLEYANRAQVNPAQFYLFGLVVMVLWLPLWVEQIGRHWTTWLRPALARGWLCALLLAAVGLLEMGFRNPHPWNGDLLYLRNWPLIIMQTSLAARLVAAVLLVVTAAAVVAFVRTQAARSTLGLVWLFALLFIAPHALVDPRYYIMPTLLLNLVAQYDRRQARRQVVWQLALTLAVCWFIAAHGSPHGGVL